MKKQKILLVEPKSPQKHVYSTSSIPLLGPPILGKIAEREGHKVKIIVENISGEVTDDELENADILGVSCLTNTIPRGIEISSKYKKIRGEKHSKTIVGGIHASMRPNDIINNFDHIVRGEAEEIFPKILSGEIKDKIIYATKPNNLDDIPNPNFEIIKNFKKIKTFPVMTSRGCPYNCNFCSVTEMFGKKYRFQSPEKVIENISNLGKKIFFIDDNFTANPKRTKNLLDLMEDYNKKWSAQVRVETAKNPELLKKMKNAGCQRVYIGLESINPETLIELNKSQTLADIECAIEGFHAHNIEVLGMFILGNDSDTKEIFKKTSEFARKYLDYAQYLISTPLPGTLLFKKLEEKLIHTKWELYDGLHAVFNPKNMTAYDLQKGMIECFSNFYSYRSAISKTLESFLDTAKTSVKRLYTNASFPSVYPIIMRVVGKKILKDWLDKNKSYLQDLKNRDYPLS